MASVVTSSSHDVGQSLLLPPAVEGGVRYTRLGFWRLIESGVFGSEPRIELVDGEILMMSPIGPWHGALVRRLDRFLQKNLPDSIECSVQLPIVVEDHSEPEPDIALIRHRDDDYKREHPSPRDVVLLIEVAQSSLAIDLGKKLRVYAAGGVPEYWVIDVANKMLIVHRDPAGATYRHVTTFVAGSSLAPMAVPDCKLDLAWLFR
jgi:Uma2 family endonuclease